ncbi:DUF6790 family protein [Microbacterium sp.]|uniref:DUF6790 family protein n=1 Tax=Microbacterium sp. TaxID=51671 RepID=UPI003C74A6AE
MSELIALAMKNFTLTFLIVAIVVTVVVIAVKRPGRHGAWATALNWFLFWAIGITYIYNGFFHIVFGDMAAASIGWENNGFQAEVGYASIGMGLVALIAFPERMPYSLKFAALVTPATFLWGAAGAHISSIIEADNFAPNNAGVILYTDLLIPVIGFALWAFTYATRERVVAPAATDAPDVVVTT